MRKAILLLLLPLLLAGEASAREARPGHLLVGFSENASRQTENRAIESAGADVVRRMGAVDVSLVRIEEGETRADVVSDLRQTGAVRFVEPDWVVRSMRTPLDPLWTTMWGLHNTGQTIQDIAGSPDADIDAPEAWDMETGLGGRAVVGIIDTGIDLQHGDLSANLWQNPGEIAGNGIDDDGNGKRDDARGWDWVGDDSNPDDEHFHGTHVAGTVAARGNNSKGVAGVSWGSRLAALRVLDYRGEGYTSDVVSAVVYAGQEEMDVVNASLGGGSFSHSFLQALQTYPSTLFVFAAGNDGTNIDPTGYYPCAYESPNVLCVAATNSADGLASFSNWGASRVDLAAPGDNIISTLPQNSSGTDRWAYLSGTSMAAPHVAGVAALLREAYPSASALDIRQWIMSSVDVLPSLQGRVATSGRLNAYRALDLALADSGTQPPTLSIDTPARTWIGTSQPRWEFSVSRASSVVCSVHPEGSAPLWTECSEPTAHSVSELGHDTAWELRIRATNSSGASEVSREFRIDLEPPAAPEITSAPPLFSSSSSPRWEFRGERDITFLCSLGTLWKNCSGGGGIEGVSYHEENSLSEGTYTFRVRQEDLAGNLSVPTEHTFTVDSTPPPRPVLLQAPPLWSPTSSAEVRFQAEGEVRCTWQGVESSCSSPWSRSDLSDGQHTLLIRARDEAGNFSQPLEVKWNTDTTAPEAPAIQGPSGGTIFPNISFSVTGEEGAEFLCGIEELRICSATEVFQNLPLGDGTFQARQRDRAGNLSPTAERTFSVLGGGPALSLGSMPLSPTSDPRPSFPWSVAGGYSVLCSIDQGTRSWGACSEESTHTPGAPLGEGIWNFRVRVEDTAGSWDEKSYVFRVDRTPPTLQLSGTSGLQNTPRAEITFSASEESSFRCKGGGGEWEACTSPWILEGLADGDQLVSVEARDIAGNVSIRTRSWQVDTTPPAPPEFIGEPLSSNPAVVSFGGEGDASFECSLDTEPWSACSSPWTRELPDGDYRLRVRALDSAGNISSDSVLQLYMGVRAPLLSPPEDGLLHFSGAESGDEYLCSWNGATERVCETPFSVRRWTNGTYTMQLRVRRGEKLSPVSSRTFAVTGAPAPPDTITYARSLRGGWSRSAALPLGLSWPAGARSVVLRTDQGEESANLNPRVTIPLPEGHTSGQVTGEVVFLGWSGAELWSGAVRALLDRTPPSIERASSRRIGKRIRVMVSVGDSHSGFSRIQWSPNGKRVAGSRASRIIVLNRSPRWIRALDAVGNASAWTRVRRR